MRCNVVSRRLSAPPARSSSTGRKTPAIDRRHGRTLVIGAGRSKLSVPRISLRHVHREKDEVPWSGEAWPFSSDAMCNEGRVLFGFLLGRTFCPMKSWARMSPTKSKNNRFMIAQPRWNRSVPEKFRPRSKRTESKSRTVPLARPSRRPVGARLQSSEPLPRLPSSKRA